VRRVSPSGSFVVIRNRRTVAVAPTLESASERLVADLQTALAQHASDWTFVHAGVVAIDDRALVLPGRSGAGKTTLVRALLGQGAAYLSDEFAIVAPSGDVEPYARPLALRLPGRPFARVRAEDLGAGVRTRSAAPAAIVFTEFSAAHGTPLVPLSAGEALLRLLPHCLGVRARTAQSLSSLRALVGRAPAFTNTRADADTMAAELIARCRSGWLVDAPAGAVEIAPRRT
jgi:hypothetical protein